MADKIILCRRDLADIGQPARFCSKDITKPNALNWCDECRVRLPIWPTDEVETSVEVAQEAIK